MAGRKVRRTFFFDQRVSGFLDYLILIIVIWITIISVACGRTSAPRSIDRLKDLQLMTELGKQGQAQAVIVIPADKAYEALADEINIRLDEIAGVKLPVVTDKLPADLMPQKNVIAIGNLANNPFIERLYFQWFAFTDGWYPGVDGYEVRSIHNPYGTGTNVILLGGSDKHGAALAVKTFCALLRPADPLTVGWILDVRLGANLDQPSDKGKAPPLLRLFTDGLETPLGYNEASRLGLMYYYTGVPRYAERFIEAVRRSRLFAQAGHYYAHHNALVWDLIEESPLFSDEDRLLVTNDLLEHARSRESGGALDLLSDQPGQLFDRHRAYIGICALTEGRYFGRDYPGSEWQRILAAVDGYFRPHLDSFASGSDLARGIFTYLEALLVYSLLIGDETIVTNGALRTWADRCAAICDPLGFLVPSGQYDELSYPYFTLRKAAYLLDDPGLLYVSEMRRRAAETQGVYELGMEFDQGQAFAGDLEPRIPQNLIGVHVVPLDPREREAFDPSVPQEKSFSKISFRSGFDEKDQFLLLDGIWGGPAGKPIQDANAILQLTDRGRTFIVDIDPETKNRRSSYVNHNVLSVTMNGESPLPPRLARLEAAADLPSFGYTHTRADPYVNGAWDRHIFWRKGGYFVVSDVFRAGRTGVYALESQWRLLGHCAIEDGRLESAVGGPGFADAVPETMAIHPAGWADEPPRPIAWPWRQSRIDISDEGVSRQYARYAGPVINRLRPTVVQSLEEGDVVGVASLFITTSPTRSRQYFIKRLNADAFIVLGDEPAWIAAPGTRGRFTRRPLAIKAKAAWVTPTRLAAHGLTELDMDGRRLLWAAEPVDTEWDLLQDVCTIKLDKPAVIQMESREKLNLAAGEHRISGLMPLSRETLNRLKNALSMDAAAPIHADPPDDETLRPALAAPSLPPVPELIPGVEIFDLAVDGAGDETLLLAGCSDGRVILLDGLLRIKWEFRTGGPVHAVEFVNLSEAKRTALAGSDDENVYALDLATGAKLWVYRAEVFPETRDYLWWTLDGKAKVRSLLAADFDRDGSDEIVLGTGGMQVEMLNADGSLRWRHPVPYGLAVRLLALCPAPGAQPFLLAGLDYLSSQSNLFRLSADGTQVSADAYPSGRQGWDYTGISDLASAEIAGGRTVLAVGRSGAHNEIWFYDAATAERLSVTLVGDSISGLAWVKTEGGPAVIVTTGAGWAISYLPDGRRIWSVPFPDAVVKSWAVGSDRIVAYCGDGNFFVLDSAGRVRARGRGDWAGAFWKTVCQTETID
jgi:outer membrane protein assembly factor BamB